MLAVFSISVSSCEMKSTICFQPLIKSSSHSSVSMSMSFEGSSSRSTVGSVRISRMSCALIFSPPDKLPMS